MADWVEAFAPVVFARHAPRAWPDLVLLDHVPFHARDETADGRPKPSRRLLFCVMGATGYTEDGRPGAPRKW